MQEDMELIEMIAADTLIAYELKRKVKKLEQRLQHLGELHQLEQRIADMRQKEGRLKTACHQWRKTWSMHAALSVNESQARSPLGLGHHYGNAQTSSNDWDRILQHSTSSLLGDSDRKTGNRPTRQVHLEASQEGSSPQQAVEADYAADGTCQVTSKGVQSATLKGWLRRSDGQGAPETADNAAGHTVAGCQVKSKDVRPLSLVGWLRRWVAPPQEDGDNPRRSSSSVEPEPATTDPGIAETDSTCVMYQNPLAKASETAPNSNRVSTSCSNRRAASGHNSSTDSASYRCSSTSGITDFYHDNLSVAADPVSAAVVTAPPDAEVDESRRDESPWQDEKPLLHGVLHSTIPPQPSGVPSPLRIFQKHCRNIFSKSRRSDSAVASTSAPNGGAEANLKARAASGEWRRSSSSGRSSVWHWGSHGNLEKLF